MTEIHELSNGIKVVIENISFYRSVSFGVWIKAGSVYENDTNNGISHMIEHMMFKGTKVHSAKDIADTMTAIGGNMNAFTSKECTCFYARTLDTHLDTAIELIGDMLCNSLIDDESLEKEKKVVVEEIAMYEDSPDDMVHEMLQYNIWKNHPLGYIISGPKTNVKGFTRDDLRRYIGKHYTGENIVISIAGNVNVKADLKKLEKCFGKLKRGKKVEIIEKPLYNRCFYSDNKDVEQAHLNIAFDAVSYYDEDRFSMSIINSILGGSINSVLFQRIREELGLTYSIYSYGSSFSDAGLLHIYASSNPTQIYSVFMKISEVLEDFKKTGIPKKQLEQTKEQLKTELIIGSESTNSRMNSNARSLMFKNRIVTTEDTLEHIDSVDGDSINKCLNKYLNQGMNSVSLIGRLKDINVDEIRTAWCNY